MLSWRKDKDSDSGQEAPRAAAGQDSYPSAAELGEMLVEAGLINADQLAEALAKAEGEGIFIGRVLVEAGSVDRKQLTSFIVKECRIPHLSLVDYEINETLLGLIPKEACLQHRVLPIDKLGRILTLAMVNPLDGNALAEMRALCPDLKIKPILCDWEDYDLVATRLFAAGGTASSEVSMSSFGLTEGPAAVEPEPAAAPAPAPESAPEPAAGASAGAPADLSGLVAAIREGMRASNQESLAILKTALAERNQNGNGGPSVEAVTEAIEVSVTQALKDGLGALVEELRAMRSAAPAPAEGGETPAPAAVAGPAPGELAEAIRESIKGAMDEAMGPLMARLAEGSPAASGVDGDALTAGIQETLRESLKELTAALPSSAAAPGGGTPQAGHSLEGMAAEIREAAEAAMQAVQAALSVQKDSIEALSTDYASKLKRFNTVQPFGGAANSDKATADALEAVVLPEDERVRQALDASAPLDGFSFDGYLVSKGNEFTVNLAKQVASAPGGEHNPYFVFGPVGIGKTHLINAVGNAIRKEQKDLRVGYASAGRFAGKVTEALHEHAAAAFREAYCHWDVLILDDIQFLGGHVDAQEEFFHIFNALQQEGRQIIIAADKAPDQLGQLEQRLISRFAGGMVTPLEPPDYETRVAILKQLAKTSKAKVPDDVLAVVATRIPRDVRRMAGAMRKIIAFTGLVGQDVNCDTAYEILNKMGVAEAVAT